MINENVTLEALNNVSNDGEDVITFSQPYAVLVRVTGTTPILFHRWSVEAIAEQAASAKGSKAKKTDNVESYVWRMPDGRLAMPSEYFRMSIINAAKYKQDPRSPRKSAMDIMKAALCWLEPLCPIFNESLAACQNWDYIDQRRVQVQRAGITRSRPALNAGWHTDVLLQCLLPEYVSPQFLNQLIQDAGRLVGVGDFRPSYGKFAVTSFEVV